LRAQVCDLDRSYRRFLREHFLSRCVSECAPRRHSSAFTDAGFRINAGSDA
jgi:hypothetical protein